MTSTSHLQLVSSQVTTLGVIHILRHHLGGEGGWVWKSKIVDGVLTVEREVGLRKNNLLTVVDGRRGGRVEKMKKC